MQDSVGVFKEALIKGFHNVVKLRSAMGCKAMCCAFLAKEFSEFMTGEISTMARTKGFDFGTMLGLCPSREGLVDIQNFVLGAKKVNMSIAGGVIGESDVVTVLPKASN